MENQFDSPLRIHRHDEFTAIGFGRVQEKPQVARLRQELNQYLFQLKDVLPKPLRAEVHRIFSGYSGGDGDFFRLFYVPVWSFLYWIPEAAGVNPDAELLQAARRAHAMALFLHLWDDHLSDHQLPVDLLRLHVRTLAWQCFAEESRLLCERAGVDSILLETTADAYLTSLHQPWPVEDLTSYSQRFRQQVAIWTLVPQLMGTYTGGKPAAQALVQVIEHFSIAWRLLDDVQDIYQDTTAGTKSAVYIALDDTGKKLWGDPRQWEALTAHLQATGCVRRVLEQVDFHLQTASTLAAGKGWFGIVEELEQCRLK
jgi:hypothetical protein